MSAYYLILLRIIIFKCTSNQLDCIDSWSSPSFFDHWTNTMNPDQIIPREQSDLPGPYCLQYRLPKNMPATKLVTDGKRVEIHTDKNIQSNASLCCVLEQDTFILASSTGSTQEDLSRLNRKIVGWDIMNQIKQTNIFYTIRYIFSFVSRRQKFRPYWNFLLHCSISHYC